MPEDDDKELKTVRLFDEDESEDNIVLRFNIDDEEDELISGIIDEKEERKFAISKDLLQEISDKWQIPLMLITIVAALGVGWLVLQKSEARIPVSIKLGPKGKGVNGWKSPRHHSFHDALIDSALIQNKLDELLVKGENPLSGLQYMERYFIRHDTGALQGGDGFIVDRMGDLYAQYVTTALGDKKREIAESVDTSQIREAVSWLNAGVGSNDLYRPIKDRYEDLVVLYDELGDRRGRDEDYEMALDALVHLVEEDPSHPRYYQYAMLHYKINDVDHLSQARAYVNESLNSDDLLEVNNRFDVKTVFGRILAREGQIEKAEEVYQDIVKGGYVTSDQLLGASYFQLGEMRMEMARHAIQDGFDPFPFYASSEEAFNNALVSYDRVSKQDPELLRRVEMVKFHIGTINMFRGSSDIDNHREDLEKAKNIFTRLRHKNRYKKALVSAIHVRLSQIHAALGDGKSAEEVLKNLFEENKNERYWDRLKLVNAKDIDETINLVSRIHEGNKEFKRQVEVLKLQENLINAGDKFLRMKNSYAIANAWVNDAIHIDTDLARESYRNAAETYMELAMRSDIRLQQAEKSQTLWRAYEQYKDCYSDRHLRKWDVPIEEEDKDSAIVVLNEIIRLGSSPTANNMLNQSLYEKGLLQEDLNMYDEAIKTHEQNIATKRYSGDNPYVYASFLQRARVKAKGGADDIVKAIEYCDEILNMPELDTRSKHWKDALFLSGDFNVRLGMRSNSPEAKVDYFKKGIKQLDEAIGRYLDSDLIMKASVTSGLGKMQLSRLDPIHSAELIAGAIKNFEDARDLSTSKNLTLRRKNLKKIALMNLGLAHLELEGPHLNEAQLAFDNLARSFRRDRVEPWALLQLHRTYRELIKYETAKPQINKNLIYEYQVEAERTKAKAISSWDQFNKLGVQKFPMDFPLEYWESLDHWSLDLEDTIKRMRSGSVEQQP